MNREALDASLYAAMAEAGADEGFVVGIDEVGRGALAGPLTVAAVALPMQPQISGLNDSKKLTAKRREALALAIEQVALAIGIVHISASEIDKLGISMSLRKAMTEALQEAVQATELEPKAVLIDGNPVHIHPKEQCIIKGDGRVACIAAASIVAKVTRDNLMVRAGDEFPQYAWQSNKGYGSAAHIAAIKEHGLSKLHRQSFCGNFMQESMF